MKSCTQLHFTDSGTIPEQCESKHPHKPERCDGVTPLGKHKGSNGIPGLFEPAYSAHTLQMQPKIFLCWPI